MRDKLLNLINSSARILVVSHISPDPDALCSMLVMGTTLKTNYPDKQIVMSSEELTGDLAFLAGYKDIELQPLVEAVNKSRPELIIIIDAMSFSRCTRGDAATVSQRIRQLESNVVVIDHHEPVNVEPNEVYINQHSPAATQDAYTLLFHDLSLNKPEGVEQTALLGILSDTNRFMYDNPGHRLTFAVVSELLEAGASIEKLENQRASYSVNEMKVFGELSSNVLLDNDYSYSYISDEFKLDWFSSGKNVDELKAGCEIFVSSYIRNIEGRKWGFVVYPDFIKGDSSYSVSFRALNGSKDVSVIAGKLGGGGHIPAAGAKFEAGSVEQALKKVEAAIVASHH